jgi:ribA/ribD-fused uncharacterized protein
MNKPINFYRTGDPYGELSNFAAFPIVVDGVTWPTTEHYFQAAKFADESHREAIRLEKSPMIAARMGRDRGKSLRADWGTVKEDVMLKALRAKFSQHNDLATLLVQTGDRVLIEHTANDSYWADGGDGSGRNRLGELLMVVRSELRARV